MKIKNWESWTEFLWKKGEDNWISRNGQDYFYRTNVVLPAIEKEIKKFKNLHSIIDLGCGDGFVVDQLVPRDNIENEKFAHMILIDRSEHFLNIAKTRLGSSSVVAIKADLESESWISAVNKSKPDRLFLSVFVLQELPCLDRFLSNLSKSFKPKDFGIFITVAPSFASYLIGSDKMKQIENGNLRNLDFRWAAEYPIANHHKTICLPYFHRTIKDYKKELECHNFRIIDFRGLSVPESRTAKEVFKKTIYGNYIMGHPSSLFFAIKKQ